MQPYLPGDPVNRIHWKLSAKRGILLIRQEEADSDAELHPFSPVQKESGRSKTLFFCLAALLSAPFFLLIPSVRLSVQALCNLLFEASEQVNAYAYERFSVPVGQSIVPAVLTLILTLAALIGLLFLSRNRWLSLGCMACIVAFQTYFGLPLPGWGNAALFAFFAFWIFRVSRRQALAAAILILLVSLSVLLLYPGIDAATEAASERVRDSLSQMARQITGASAELPPGETEVRRAHTQTLTAGDGEALAEKEYRLETEEEQLISKPRWFSLIKVVSLLFLTVLVVVLPFSPFVWLNARRRKALKARSAFQSGNVSAAICVIFRQIASWLEVMGHGAGNLPYRDWTHYLSGTLPPDYIARFDACAALFEEAAYSDHLLNEDHRRQALELLNETEAAMLKRANRRQRFQLKYVECLWIENT
ncbi:MAG: DUF58 domain-containing protein [Clostridia bacterium]|nr:DUF58 domain-containing protein [Clostridia bacterium]